MRFIACGIVVLLITVTGCCRQEPETDSLRAEILELHRGFIQAHLDKDVEFIVKPTAPGYLFVSDGVVKEMDIAGMREMLSAYLDSTEFAEYGDVADPVIGFSDDGSLAWAIVQVRVAGTRALSDGTFSSHDTLWAWITLYRRSGDGWLRIADVSTNRPYTQ
jgi:hypothetical protein